jgi:hypothetical protein
MVCPYDRVTPVLYHHAGRPPVPSLAFCDRHLREANLNNPDLEAIIHELP